MIRSSEEIVHFHLAMNTSHTRMHHVIKFIIGREIKTLKLAELISGPLKPGTHDPGCQGASQVSGWLSVLLTCLI